jgi:alcohol dehydrogenase class IV
MRLVAENLARAVENGRDPAARAHMLMAAAMGATAFQKGLGLIHALSHPVGGITGLHHGTANAIFLPYVMIHNRPAIEARMRRLARTLELPPARSEFDAVLEWFLALRRRIGLPESLSGLVAPGQIATLVPMVLADPSLETNPKPCTAAEIDRVLRRAIAGDLSA